MESKANYTLRLLLDELGKSMPSFEEGQIYETIKTIYPNANEMKREKRNILIEGVTITKPLAVSKKSKELFIKEKSPLVSFFKDTFKGDFLKVIKVEGSNAYCKNISLDDKMRDKYYKDELVKITKEDLFNGVIKQFKRNVNKYLEE